MVSQFVCSVEMSAYIFEFCPDDENGYNRNRPAMATSQWGLYARMLYNKPWPGMALDKPFSSFAEKCVELLSASTSETAAATLCCFSIRGDLSPHTHHTQLQTADQHPMQAKQFVHGAPLCLNSHSSGHSFSPLVRARDFNGQVFGKLWTRHDRYESAWLQFTLHTDFRWWGKEGLEFMLQPRINLRYTAAEWVLLCLAAVDLRVHMRGNCEAIASRVGLHTILAHTHKSNASLSLTQCTAAEVLLILNSNCVVRPQCVRTNWMWISIGNAIHHHRCLRSPVCVCDVCGVMFVLHIENDKTVVFIVSPT